MSRQSDYKDYFSSFRLLLWTYFLVRLWRGVQVEDPCHPRSLQLSALLQTHPWTPGHPGERRSSLLPGPGRYSVWQTPVKSQILSKLKAESLLITNTSKSLTVREQRPLEDRSSTERFLNTLLVFALGRSSCCVWLHSESSTISRSSNVCQTPLGRLSYMR